MEGQQWTLYIKQRFFKQSNEKTDQWKEIMLNMPYHARISELCVHSQHVEGFWQKIETKYQRIQNESLTLDLPYTLWIETFLWDKEMKEQYFAL